jgi:cyclophilin family peptidyl-prolyl cis-trans isomerase
MKKVILSVLIISVVLIFSQCTEENNSVLNPSATTNAATLVTGTTAVLNGEVIANNEATTVVFEWGLTTAYGNLKKVDQSQIPLNAKTNVTLTLDSLADETTYHYRILSTYKSGQKAGADMTFSTLTVLHELVLIHTDFGNMLIWLYDQTPQHKANFLSLTKSKFYDSLIFHRVIPDFMIQGGDPLGNGTGGPGYTIPAEFNDSLLHVYGAVGAARDNNPEKRSSGSQFYIVENLPGAHHLDQLYTVFGFVVDGIANAVTIAAVPKDTQNKPLTNVYMTKVEVVTYTAGQLKSQFNFTIPRFK